MDKRIHPQFRELVEQANKGEGKFAVMDVKQPIEKGYYYSKTITEKWDKLNE